MNVSTQKIYRISLSVLLAASVILPLQPAIAKPNGKPKPKPTETTVERVTTTVTNVENFSEEDVWEEILSDLQADNVIVATGLFEGLRSNTTLRDQLLTLFWGQSGDRTIIEEILQAILLGHDDDDDQSHVIHYSYRIDRACLPPGQLQRLDSGKPVPAGILKKCGRLITVDD